MEQTSNMLRLYVSYARKGEFSGDSRASGHSIEKNRANLTEMDN